MGDLCVHFVLFVVLFLTNVFLLSLVKDHPQLPLHCPSSSSSSPALSLSLSSAFTSLSLSLSLALSLCRFAGARGVAAEACKGCVQ